MRRVAVHEDGTLGRGPARRDRVTVHLAGDGVAVSASDRAPARRSGTRHGGEVARHRDDAGRHRDDAGRHRDDAGRHHDDVDRAREDVVRHREDVVRRLLERGLSPRLLRELVPEFDAVVDRVERG
jgi:hypothetical protein